MSAYLAEPAVTDTAVPGRRLVLSVAVLAQLVNYASECWISPAGILMAYPTTSVE
jgi:hypothetical protein